MWEVDMIWYYDMTCMHRTWSFLQVRFQSPTYWNKIEASWNFFFTSTMHLGEAAPIPVKKVLPYLILLQYVMHKHNSTKEYKRDFMQIDACVAKDLCFHGVNICPKSRNAAPQYCLVFRFTAPCMWAQCASCHMMVLEGFFVQTPAVERGFCLLPACHFCRLVKWFHFLFVKRRNIARQLIFVQKQLAAYSGRTVNNRWIIQLLKERRLMPPVPLEMGLFCHKRGDCNAALEFFIMQTRKNDLIW